MIRLTLEDVIWRERALGPIDLDLELEGVVVLLGPNGAGKSSLLSLVHGIETPDQGRISWDSERAKSSKLFRGFVHQTPLLWDATVRKNLEFAADVLPLNEQNLESISHDLELFAHIDANVNQLSGGGRARVALARALTNEPDVLLLDEPTANLDPKHRNLFEKMIKQFVVGDSTNVIISTHDISMARRIADYVIFVDNGKIIGHGKPSELIDRYCDKYFGVSLI